MGLGYATDYFADFTHGVEAVMAAGGTVTDEYQALRARWDEFKALDGTPTVARVINAVMTGNGDLVALRAQALGEAATAMEEADLVNPVKSAVLAGLRAEYAHTAASNYAKLAAQFNLDAVQFVAAADSANLETAAVQMVSASNPARTAWTNGQLVAFELDRALPALALAARLAGAPIPDNANGVIGLVLAGLDDHGRRAVWAAWEATGRCGRWSALHAEGIRIEALTDLDGFEVYREPMPMQTRQQHTGMGVRYVQFDPEEEIESRRPAVMVL